MEGETSWVSHYLDDSWTETITITNTNTITNKTEFDSFSEIIEEGYCKDVSLDLILPDDLLERILAYLPIGSIFRAGCVCKRWNEIVSSRRFFSNVLSQKPWYFMFTSSEEPIGYAYDPLLKKWHGIDLPCIETSSWFVASSCGLVCFMDNDTRTSVFVCNPITRSFKKIIDPPGLRFSDYTSFSMFFNRKSKSYLITIVKSKQVPDNFHQWEVSIHVYDSGTMTWTTTVSEVLNGWRGGVESVICDGVLYFMIHSTIGGGLGETRHGVVTYNLTTRSSDGLLTRNYLAVPCSLTCGRLMNLRERLVMVGGIGKQDRTDIIKGIGIWVLVKNGREWFEVSRMPHRYFQGFGEFDDVFASSGNDDLVYVQSYGGPALLVFDMSLKQWRWSQKCPVTKRFPLQLFSGFCFEPRLEICP
ncbi:F-box/kelch-repeat protein At3g61590 [Impatiens glandulifera]|uniref:F-box/kelch-repeat protein At3g61590 n=1 Tax=Impatiens glandulifera TaxID=253017 RepID=UPI001FB11AEC|nr:F-box/kelch-repeat protein At3g61590 [Impatiens glandulifera]